MTTLTPDNLLLISEFLFYPISSLHSAVRDVLRQLGDDAFVATPKRRKRRIAAAFYAKLDLTIRTNDRIHMDLFVENAWQFLKMMNVSQQWRSGLILDSSALLWQFCYFSLITIHHRLKELVYKQQYNPQYWDRSERPHTRQAWAALPGSKAPSNLPYCRTQIVNLLRQIRCRQLVYANDRGRVLFKKMSADKLDELLSISARSSIRTCGMKVAATLAKIDESEHTRS